MKRFTIHAGTHKTATSYIQSRMRANREQLKELGVSTDEPGPASKKHKPLAAALRQGQWRYWNHYLDRLSNKESNVLVSAEQFTQPLSRPEGFEPLIRLLAKKGYELKIVIFLRNQPDYMNARYVHSTRRLYHCQPFEKYVRQQLRFRAHIFDYGLLFRELLQCNDLTTDFLVYQSGCADPFDRLVQHLGLRHPEGWLPADRERGNVQPGCRGVWLAQQVTQHLYSQGMSPKRLKNTGHVVRRIAKREGWDRDRYFGFSQELGQYVQDHYANSNQEFAQRVWGRDWEKQFTAPLEQQRIYKLPTSGPENEKMLSHVQEALSVLSLKGNRS